jgi:hypothetical protein
MKDNESEMIEKIRKVFEEYGYTFDRYDKQAVGISYFTPFGRRFESIDSKEDITFHLNRQDLQNEKIDGR